MAPVFAQFICGKKSKWTKVKYNQGWTVYTQLFQITILAFKIWISIQVMEHKNEENQRLFMLWVQKLGIMMRYLVNMIYWAEYGAKAKGGTILRTS